MLPSKVFQINYQDYSFLVNKDIEVIKKWEKINGKFDFVLGKIRNGIFASSIIANELQLPMGVFEAPRHIDYSNYRVFLPQGIEENKTYKVLVVDSLCGTGETLGNIKSKLGKDYPLLEVVTYCPITDKGSPIKPDILTLEINDFIQPPWESRSFTPQAHLDRLESYDIKASPEKDDCFGFADFKIQKEVENFLGYTFFWNLNFEKEYDKINSTSGVSTLAFGEDGLNDIQELKTTYINLLKIKEQFIKENGITHFFEQNLKQAMLLSQLCPITKFIYFEDDTFFKINAFAIEIND